MLQNATPLRKSAAWPSISDERVSCIAHATRNPSVQILFKCPTPAIVFGNATKPSRFSRFWQHAQSLAPATRNDIRTSKSGPNCGAFNMLTLKVLRATTARTFSTCQLPKVLRDRQFLTLLPGKRSSRQNGVLFFDISTSKSGPTLVCFVRFDFEMYFAPQRRSLFRHHMSEHEVFRATTACNFSSLIWPDGSAPAALASLLFDPPEPQIIGKTQCFATFLPFRAPESSFFWDFLFSDLLSSLTLPTSAFPSVHIVGGLISKLPSIIVLPTFYRYDHPQDHQPPHPRPAPLPACTSAKRSPVLLPPNAPPWAILAHWRTLALMDWPQWAATKWMKNPGICHRKPNKNDGEDVKHMKNQGKQYRGQLKNGRKRSRCRKQIEKYIVANRYADLEDLKLEDHPDEALIFYDLEDCPSW